MPDNNPAALDYWTFDKEYPLHSNAAILNIGSAGSGKSYFTYKYILPIYIKYGGIKTVLICSRTGRLDTTTNDALHSPLYKNVAVEFVKSADIFKRCQEVRAEAMVNEFLIQLMKMDSEKKFDKICKKVNSLISDTGKEDNLPDLVEELKYFNNYMQQFKSITLEEVKDYAELMFKSGSQLVHNPVLVVFDDYSGSDEFMKPYSAVHKLIYVRRHLHLTMLINVQSLTTVSTNIRRNTTVFICFSTMSERDLKLLSDRLPIKWTFKTLIEAFVQISEAENRNDKVLTLFTVYPNHKIVIGTPECLLKVLNS